MTQPVERRLFSVVVSRTEVADFRLYATSSDEAVAEWRRRGKIVTSQVTVLNTREMPTD